MIKYIIVLFPIFFTSLSIMAKESLPRSQKREMRAVWIASILNLDYPSKNNLTVEEQKQEFINLLDTMAYYHFNTIVMQVRPAGEVLYPSAYEPWASVLTGIQGEAPNPYYDPLKFMIKESHKRNIDFHAWINPYRAVFNYKKAKLAENHPVKKHPEWFIPYGRHLYYNPALAETRKFITQIVGELTTKYDIDAIHLDDYFYPYPINGKDFPDDKDFKKNNRGYKEKNAWRRDNVNLIIKNIHDTIKQSKPWVQLGISPFGVWRNKSSDPIGSETKAGITNYDDLYADVLYWIENNWVDYITPQIYWHIGHPQADYKTLVNWWNKYSRETHLYIGHALYKVGKDKQFEAWNDDTEILKQLSLNRNIENIKGSMFFRGTLLSDSTFSRLKSDLREDLYHYFAIPPATITRTENKSPEASIKRLKKRTFKLSWNSKKGNKADSLKYYLIYMFEGKRKVGNIDNPHNIIKRTTNNELILHKARRPRDRRKRTFVITRVNRANQESKISNIIYKKL